MRSLRVGLGWVVFTCAVVSGCAHTKPSLVGSDVQAPQTIKDVLKRDQVSTIRMSPQGEIIVRGITLQNTQFDFPITINSRVEYWVDYFQGRGRKHFTRYLERSELFIPYIAPLLKQSGMPEDLVYLAMIESGFNNHARSRAKAVGPWQFISATGKRYGLMVNWWVDERRDTRKATLSAVEYLRDLYNMFQSWELAAAAYNAGEAKIARAIRRYGSKDFWTLARQRFLRPETRDYVPKIIAAAIIAKNRTQFGFPASTLHPGAGEVVAGDGEVVKVEQETNAPAQPTPAAQEETVASVLKGEAESNAYDDNSEDLPQGSLSLASVAINKTSNGLEGGGQPLAKPIPTPNVSKKGEVSGEELAEFEVQSPADLLRISHAAGLSYNTVKSLNPELLRWCTPPIVNSFRIKLPASVKDKFLETYNHSAFPRKVEFLTYKVRRGETLLWIARHFGIKVDPIADLNKVSSRMPLRTGMRVLLPMPNDRSRTLVSLDVRDPPEQRRYRRRKSSAKDYKISLKRREGARARPISLQDNT